MTMTPSNGTAAAAALVILAAAPLVTAQPTLATVLANRVDLDSFNLILDSSGFSRLFRMAGFVGTSFAPNDDAFSSLPPALFSNLLDSEWADHTTCFVSYHTVEGRFTASSLQNGTELTTLDGDVLSVSGPNPTRINDARVVETDIAASNGVAHILDQVLVPSCVSQNIFQQLNTTADFSILANLIERAGLVDEVSNNAPTTLFAPPNQAWEAMGERFVEELSTPDNLVFLRAFLLNHIVPGNWYESRLESDVSFSLQTALGTTAFFYNESDTRFVTNSQITQGNMLGSNGVFHTTDSVIILAAVADILLNAHVVSDFMSFTNFTSALMQANFFDALFLDSLNSPRTTTVFAPNDEAFSQVPTDVLEKLLDVNWNFHLRELLRFHLVDGTLKSNQLVQLETLTTLSGFNLTITTGRNMLLVDNATVVYRDLTAYNGVIYGIDNVLFPPSLLSTLLEQLGIVSEFSTFLGFLQASDDLITLLEGDGPMTLFIPTNAAFDVFDSTVDSSQFSPDDIEMILQYHVVESNVFLNEMANGTMITTLNGQNVTVSERTLQDMENVRIINDAEVIDGGLASNGVLYVLDQVLQPKLPSISPTVSPAPTINGFVASTSTPTAVTVPTVDTPPTTNPDSSTEAPASGAFSFVQRRISRIVTWGAVLLFLFLQR